ncbi:MAG: hypothetical protein ACP5PV_01345 [Methanothrix sp.]
MYKVERVCEAERGQSYTKEKVAKLLGVDPSRIIEIWEKRDGDGCEWADYIWAKIEAPRR